MADTPITGVDGDITFISGHNAHFDSWSLVPGQRIVNITSFDSGGYEENYGGLKYGTFSATGHPSYDAASTDPGIASMTKAGATATFTVAAGCTIAAKCIVATAPISQDVNGQPRVGYSGPTSGTITVAWDEGV